MKKTILFTLLVLLALPAAAGTVSVDESRKADSDADITIELIAGEVRIVGWSRNEVRVQGTINDRWETLEVDGDSGDISIEIMPPDGSHRNVKLEADLKISVPAGAEISFESVSAPLIVEDLKGSLSVESVSGNIKVSGTLEELSIESISAVVDLDIGATDSVEIETVSGKIDVRGDLRPDSDYSISAVSGVITLYVPSGASADYEIETFSGSIDNDFGPKPKKADFLPSKSLSFSVGSGSADVEISAVSGTIRLKAD